MTALHLQALHWSSDGELDPCDLLVVLQTLIPDSLPTTQLELIQTVEKLAICETEITLQVS